MPPRRRHTSRRWRYALRHCPTRSLTIGGVRRRHRRPRPSIRHERPLGHPARADARPAVGRPRGQPRPGGPPAADLPRDHRRVRGRRCRPIAFLAAARRDRLPGVGPAELRRADPARRRAAGCSGSAASCSAAGSRRMALATSFMTFADPEHRVADRRLAAAPGRQRAARRAVPARAARLRDQRPHRGRQRRDGGRRGDRRAAHRRRRLARRLDRCSALPAIARRPRDPAVVRETRHRPGGGPRRRQRSSTPFGRILARPRPPLAVPDVRPRRRRSRARRRQPVRADLHDPGHRRSTTRRRA